MDFIAEESSSSEVSRSGNVITTSTTGAASCDLKTLVLPVVPTADGNVVVGSTKVSIPVANVSQDTAVVTAIATTFATVDAHDESLLPRNDGVVSVSDLPQTNLDHNNSTMNRSDDGNDKMDHDRSIDTSNKHESLVTASTTTNTAIDVSLSVSNSTAMQRKNEEEKEDRKEEKEADTFTKIGPEPNTAAMNSTSNNTITNNDDKISNTNRNGNAAMAFTSETATLSQKINRIGSSYSHMSVGPPGTTATTSGGMTGSSGGIIQTIYGRPVHVNDSNGSFPNVSSVLGPYFCLGQLGKGTFSTIHKCIDMQYYHNSNTSTNTTKNDPTSSTQPQPHRRHQVVAAKVELGSFQQSGVLESEATMLDYLHRHVQPLGTVPTYIGHFRSDKFAALLMEFLPGEDMYQIRERVMAINNASLAASSSSFTTATTVDPTTTTRRISVDDAVYLTADVMLPLLRSIHAVGVVHRDVKPSNCVRKNERDDCKNFCMVDFGLSKSIIVAEDSDIADTDHPWIDGYPWMKPLNYAGTKAYYRKERIKADFRGTSMYASLRVHQGKDYCARDDMWSLLYVFCDLISGGLPWMSMAANRDRTACQKIKEWIHGEGAGDTDSSSPKEHHIDELLKGDLYHIAKYRRDRQKEAKVDTEHLSPVPEPLNLSSAPDKIFVLKEAFEHLSTLQFWDMPDYDKIQSAVRYFKDNQTSASADAEIPLIDWSTKRTTKLVDHRMKHWWSSSFNVPEWILSEDDNNRIDDGIFDDVDLIIPNRNGHDDFRKRLPIELQFQLAQMNYNLISVRVGSLPSHRALNDWMRVILPLLHHEWNSRLYEDGGHRTITDGFKRPCYLELLRQCASYAEAFDNFQSRECFYETESIPSEVHGSDAPATNGEPHVSKKRRKIVVQCGTTTSLTNSDLIFVSKTLFGLEYAIRVETSKKTPPPVRISFG